MNSVRTLQVLCAIAVGGAAFALTAISPSFGTRQPTIVTAVPDNPPAPPAASPPATSRPVPSPTAPTQETPAPEAPPEIKAIYLTSWSAATPSRVVDAITLIKMTELNGIVIDVKDYSGKVMFRTSSPLIGAIGSEEPRLGDLTQLVQRFHQAGIYVVARLAVFQDQHLVTVRPDLAVKDPQGRIWRDRKGLGWVDPAAEEVWTYIIAVAREAAAAGVDELNFDYIRFPTDGRLSNLRYPIFDETRESKRQVIRRFFEVLVAELRPTGKQLSADLFGLATVKSDDLGIGQVLEDAFPYFDVISPMVYPSHYAKGFLQYRNPAAHPYEVVRYSLGSAVLRRERFARSAATIRPWLQAFDLGAPYPPAAVRKQIQAVHDAGLTSGWYLWSPSNRYQQASLASDR